MCIRFSSLFLLIMLLRIFYLFISPKSYLGEHKLIATVFKTRLQYISSEMQAYHQNLTISQLILKVACRVQIWKKKHFVKIVASFVTVLFKMTLCFCIYFVFTKKTILLSQFKIDTLNFTMYILTILTSPLKIYAIGLHSLISMNIVFNI